METTTSSSSAAYAQSTSTAYDYDYGQGSSSSSSTTAEPTDLLRAGGGDRNMSGVLVQTTWPSSAGAMAHDNSTLMTIAALYAALFMLGTCGNAALLAVVYQLRRATNGGGNAATASGADSPPTAAGSIARRARHRSTTNTLLFVCALSVVDFLSVLPLPTTIVDLLLGYWLFGTYACKTVRLLEHCGKVLSTFLLVAFSVDRYRAVCRPLRIATRSSAAVYKQLGTMVLTTLALVSPVFFYANAKEFIISERWDPQTRTIHRVHIFKCVDDLGGTLFIVFSLYSFVFAYLAPILIMTVCYERMLSQLFRQSRNSRRTLNLRHSSSAGGSKPGSSENVQSTNHHHHHASLSSSIPVTRIAVYTLAICLFHVLCWTPYWLSVLYALWTEYFAPATHEEEPVQLPSKAFIYFMYGVHSLPYVNSASNFILYGLLNKHTTSGRSNTRRRQSRNATHSMNTADQLSGSRRLRVNPHNAQLSSVMLTRVDTPTPVPTPVPQSLHLLMPDSSAASFATMRAEHENQRNGKGGGGEEEGEEDDDGKMALLQQPAQEEGGTSEMGVKIGSQNALI